MIGAIIQNRYHLTAELGRGGMGVVYRAHDTLLERDIAIKVLNKAKSETQGHSRLLHEARATAKLNHPNIISVYDAGETKSLTDAQSVPFIVMELVEGLPLNEHPSEGLDQVMSFARQICAALEHAHANGIIHRDLKPENVMVLPDGTAKLMDFGLARTVASRMTTEGALVGTVFYLAPEQALGEEVDNRADLYALGVLLYELATGGLPFTAQDPFAVITQHLYTPVIPPRAKNPEIPPNLDALIVQLLNKMPQDRPPSASDVLQTLESVAQVVRISTSTLSQRLGLSSLNQLVRGRLVGREHEFAEAKSLWLQAASASGDARVLLISGEPGVGKTPLMREVRAFAQVSGGKALIGECYAQGSAPYAAIAQIVREALSIPDLDLPPLALADLVALAPDLKVSFPNIPPNPPLDPLAEQQRLFESMVALCTHVSKQTPLMLIIEDVQWADDATLFLLRHLARRGRSSKLRLLLVLTYRETELDRSCCLGDVLLDFNRERLSARLKLIRLNREQTRAFLGVMFQDDISDELLDGIYRETEGNPFFIEEVCKALIQEGKIYRDNGNWDRQDMTDIQVPQSVRLAIQSRTSRLPDQAQEVLRLAAIIGREFDFDTLQQVSELDEDALIEVLELAERVQLIHEVKRAKAETFAFAHGLTLTTLRESVSGLRRRRLHRRVATILQKLHPDDYEALAYHYGQAQDKEHTLKYTRKAADRARKLYANAQAIDLYTGALALLPADQPERFDVLAARAQVYDLIARRQEQHADVQAMLALADRLDDDGLCCDALIALSDYYLVADPLCARQSAEQAVEFAQSLDDPVRQGFALRCLGIDARFKRDAGESRDALEKAAVCFKEAERLNEAAICLHHLSLALGDLGQADAALKAVEKALALSRQAGDRRQEATSLRRLAIVYMHLHQLDEALPIAQQALALHRELGDKTAECNALNVIGLVLARLKRSDEAQDYIQQSLQLAEDIGLSLGIANAISNLVEFHYHRLGKYQAGLAFIEQQLEKFRFSQDRYLLWHLQGWHIRFLGFFAQYAQALELTQALRAEAGDVLGQSRFLDTIGNLYAELGDYTQAFEHLGAALELSSGALDRAGLLAHRANAVWRQGEPDWLRFGLEKIEQAIEMLPDTERDFTNSYVFSVAARLHLALGQADQALQASTRSLELAGIQVYPSEANLFTHSRALRAAGRDAEANDYLQRAYERIKLVADNTQDEALRRAWLEDVKFNREIVADVERYT